MFIGINSLNSDLFKLKFLLKQKALPENFVETGLGFSNEILNKISIQTLGDSSYCEKIIIKLPVEIGEKSIAESKLRIAGLFGQSRNNNSYIVSVDDFRILIDQDIAAPLQDLVNSPFYLAATFQKGVAGLNRVLSPEGAGDLLRIITVRSDIAIVNLRKDVSPSVLKLFGVEFDLEAHEKGASYCISIQSLISGTEAISDKLRLQDKAAESLNLIASKLLGNNSCVIAYNMIVDGAVGVGVESEVEDKEIPENLAAILNSIGVSQNRFNLRETNVQHHV